MNSDLPVPTAPCQLVGIKLELGRHGARWELLSAVSWLSSPGGMKNMTLT